jgi:hypothetical protein
MSNNAKVAPFDEKDGIILDNQDQSQDQSVNLNVSDIENRGLLTIGLPGTGKSNFISPNHHKLDTSFSLQEEDEEEKEVDLDSVHTYSFRSHSEDNMSREEDPFDHIMNERLLTVHEEAKDEITSIKPNEKGKNKGKKLNKENITETKPEIKRNNMFGKLNSFFSSTKNVIPFIYINP